MGDEPDGYYQLYRVYSAASQATASRARASSPGSHPPARGQSSRDREGRRGLGDQPRQVMSSMLIIPYRRKFLKLSFAHLRLLDRFLEARFDGR